MRADFGRVTLTEVIFELVNHHGAADDGVRAIQRNLRILNRKLAPARGGHDVPEVTRVTHRVRRRTVIHLVRVEVRAGGHASIRRVAEFVNVQPVLARGQTGDGTDNLRRAVAVLGHLEHARHARGAGQHAHRLLRRE